MKSRTLLSIGVIATFLVLSTSCGSTKGYSGEKIPDSQLAIIKSGERKLEVKNKKTSESALLVKVDSITVGSYTKGWPKQVKVKQGDVTVEIRHFQQWKENAVGKGAALGAAGALGGLIGGAIVGSVMESNNPHTHYKLTFPVEQGKTYTIMPRTDVSTEISEFFVIEYSANDTIHPNVVQIEKKEQKK